MHDVKRHMPVDPVLAKKGTQPALAIRATDPNLSGGFEDSMHMVKHIFRIEGMLQHI